MWIHLPETSSVFAVDTAASTSDLAWREFVRQGGPEPAIRRDADGSASRVDRLRLLGNGVVPQQAALAIRELIQCNK